MTEIVSISINKASQEVWNAWVSKHPNVSKSVIDLIAKDLEGNRES